MTLVNVAKDQMYGYLIHAGVHANALQTIRMFQILKETTKIQMKKMLNAKVMETVGACANVFAMSMMMESLR